MVDALRERAQTAADVARDAVDWFADPRNAAKVGGERGALSREFKRHGTSARRLAAAVDRPMCVGVYGPSQAGKSYLVSVLARPGNGSALEAVLGDERYNFIAEINPRGDKESTGLVTRFTIRNVPTTPGFPVSLRLLSQTDIVKIIANTFFMEGDLKHEAPPDAKAITSLLADAKARIGEKPYDDLIEDDVLDIEDYIASQFDDILYAQALAPYWAEAAAVAPRLGIADRGTLFSVIWGRHEPFTRLYRDLAEALAKLEHVAEAFCPIAALVPRETSIIDVASLSGLGQQGQATVAIRSKSGRVVDLPRPLVTALTAELQIRMAETPWPFFEHTDLLDFPGARSRQRRRLETYFEESPEALTETFLRGKVAYLFDRYVAEQELTSMLLCIRDSNQEVSTLPGMIDQWIRRTHGDTSAERAGQRCVLFLILTMFDKHFVETAGEDADRPGLRFDNRLHASLTNFFGNVHAWPREWTPGRPFNNAYWLRNPNYPAESIIRYDSEKRETGLVEGKDVYIERLRTAYLQQPKVQAHFSDPGRAFDEALKLNDGGVTYLASQLTPVCDPLLKRAQIAGELTRLAQRMREALQRFYDSEDATKHLEERLAVADAIVDELYRDANRGRIGRLVRLLQVDAPALEEVLYRAETGPVELASQPVHVIESVQRSESDRPRPGGRPLPGRSPPAPAGPQPPRQPVLLTREELLARTALDHWMQALHRLPENARLPREIDLSAKAVSELVGELIQAARRTRLETRIAEVIRRFTHFERMDSAAKPALVAAAAINRHVAFLGFDTVSFEQRPAVPEANGERHVFATRAVVHDVRALRPDPARYTDIFETDWAFALHGMVRANAETKDGRVIDHEANSRLGALLGALAAPMPE